MDRRELSISDAFGYLYVITVAWAYFWLTAPGLALTAVRTINDAGGVVLLGVLGLAGGGLIHALYRALLYEPIIQRSQDGWHNLLGTHNARTLLRARHPHLTFSEARHVWLMTREEFLSELLQGPTDRSYSRVHLLYMAGTLGVLAGVANAVLWVYAPRSFGLWPIMLILAALFLTAGFLQDRRRESLELLQLLRVDDGRLYELVVRLQNDLEARLQEVSSQNRAQL